MTIKKIVLVFTVCIIYVAAADAADVAYAMSYTGDYTNNFRLETENDDDEFTNNYRLGFTVDQEGASVEASIDAWANYQQYTKDERGNETQGYLDLTSVWHARPGTFDWHLRNRFRQVPVDDAEIDVPDNRQNSNTLSTGPDFIFRVTPADTIRLESRYVNYYFEDTERDSQGHSTSLRWIRALSARSSSSINATYSGTDFDNDMLSPDFERIDAYWAGEFTRNDNTLSINLGVTSLDREGDAEDVDGFMGSLAATRALSSRSTLSFDVSSEYSDTGRANAGDVPAFFDGDIFYRTDASLILRRDNPEGFGFGLRAHGADIDFEDLGRDREIYGGSVDVTRRISNRLNVNARVNYTETDFSDATRTDKDWDANIVFNFQWTRATVVFLGGNWRERDSDDPFDTYDEAGAIVGFRYAGGRR